MKRHIHVSANQLWLCGHCSFWQGVIARMKNETAERKIRFYVRVLCCRFSTNSEKCQNPIFDSCQLFLDRCLQFEDIN